jgi:hypothetical protein
VSESPSIAYSGASWLPQRFASIPPARALTAILALALIIRLYLSVANFCISGDGIAYLVMARDFASGDPMAALRQVFSPLYPLIIAGAHFVIPNWELAGDLVSAVIGTAAVASIFAMTREAFARRDGFAYKDVAIGAAALAAIHPALAAYSASVRTEAGYIAFMTSAAWLVLKAIRTRRWSIAATAGAVGGLAYLYRTEGIGMLLAGAGFLVAQALIWRRSERAWALGAAIIFSGAFLAVAAPYLFYLRANTGHWNIGREFTAAMMYGMGDVSRNGEAWRRLGYANVSPLAPIFANPVLYAEKVGGDFLGSFYAFAEALGPVPVGLLVLGLWSRGRAILANPGEAFLAALVTFYFCGLAFSYTGIRFMVHLIPFTLGWAIVGLEALAAIARRVADARAIRLPEGAVAAAAAIVILPQTLWPIGYDMRGIRYAGEEIARRSTNRGAVIAKDKRVAWYADAPFVMLPAQPDGNFCTWLASQKGAEYVMLNERDERRFGVADRRSCVVLLKRYPRYGDGYYDLFAIGHSRGVAR